MKKIVATAIILCTFLGIGIYTFMQPKVNTEPNPVEDKNRVPFEKAKLVDTKIDKNTGVQIDVYTIEDWENE
ncbi:hypothetical protein DX933_12285 [Ornithinibacillus gellani]|uniref:hypothetical protein n=1 Tax=Ornithinibacillus gellani TaxID=2293253 RepID=UPI000F49DDAC|nr:hypothetical protein [Ornithinibacillus gellani]TQS74101.1 hypothetical protein DX933_12285 [Ornithinibacillus gellani]